MTTTAWLRRLNHSHFSVPNSSKNHFPAQSSTKHRYSNISISDSRGFRDCIQLHHPTKPIYFSQDKRYSRGPSPTLYSVKKLVHSSSTKMSSLDPTDEYQRDQQNIVILQLMIHYQFETGQFPVAESLAFYEYVKESELLPDITSYQLKIKIWFLRKLFHMNVRKDGKEQVFKDPSLKQRFELSKKIWGGGRFQEDDAQNYNVDCFFMHPHTSKPVTLSAKKRRRLDHHHQDFQEISGENDVEVDPRDKDFQDIAILKSILYLYHNSRKIPPPGSLELHKFVGESILKRGITRADLAERIVRMEGSFRNTTEAMGTQDVNFPDPLEQEKHDLSRQIWGDRKFQDGAEESAEDQEDDAEDNVSEEEEQDDDDDDDEEQDQEDGDDATSKMY